MTAYLEPGVAATLDCLIKGFEEFWGVKYTIIEGFTLTAEIILSWGGLCNNVILNHDHGGILA